MDLSFINPSTHHVQNMLEINPELIFWTSVTLIFLVLVLWKSAWRPIIDAIDARNNKIENDLKDAEKAKQEINKIEDEQDRIMLDAKEKSLQVVEDMRREAIKYQQGVINVSRKEAETILDAASKEINQAKENAKNDAKPLIYSLSFDIASKIIGHKVDENQYKNLIEGKL